MHAQVADETGVGLVIKCGPGHQTAGNYLTVPDLLLVIDLTPVVTGIMASASFITINDTIRLTLAVTDEGSPLPTDPTTLRALLGYAESLFHLGEWSAALPRFNKLAIALPPADPIRWKSLLRDLQCRTALQHPPRDLINVIEQQRFLYPDLGGPALAPEFEKLQRENQRRSDSH